MDTQVGSSQQLLELVALGFTTQMAGVKPAQLATCYKQRKAGQKVSLNTTSIPLVLEQRHNEYSENTGEDRVTFEISS